MSIVVYLPVPDRLPHIAHGSGVVGTPDPATGRILIDYEGNLNGATNIINFADRVHHAAGRHHQRYPTVARSLVGISALNPIGTYDPETGDLTLDDDDDPGGSVYEQLAAWCQLETPEDVPDQLHTAGSKRHTMRRDVLAALNSPDQARKFAAQQMNTRYQLGL